MRQDGRLTLTAGMSSGSVAHCGGENERTSVEKGTSGLGLKEALVEDKESIPPNVSDFHGSFVAAGGVMMLSNVLFWLLL